MPQTGAPNPVTRSLVAAQGRKVAHLGEQVRIRRVGNPARQPETESGHTTENRVVENTTGKKRQEEQKKGETTIY